MIRTLMNKKRRGAALVEYGLLIAGVALIGAAAVSIFGHKTSDLVAAVATVLPGAHADDNGAITSGKLIETSAPTGAGAAATPIALSVSDINANSVTERLGNNLLGTTNNTGTNALTTLVREAN